MVTLVLAAVKLTLGPVVLRGAVTHRGDPVLGEVARGLVLAVVVTATLTHAATRRVRRVHAVSQTLEAIPQVTLTQGLTWGEGGRMAECYIYWDFFFLFLLGILVIFFFKLGIFVIFFLNCDFFF